MWLLRPYCWLREIIRTLDFCVMGITFSGHDFVEVDKDTLRCEVCGYVSVAKEV